MTGRGDGLLQRDDVPAVIVAEGARPGRIRRGRGEGRAAKQNPDIAPAFTRIQSVKRMAGSDARLAAGALVEIHLEGVLLAGTRRVQRNQFAIVRGEQRRIWRVVPPRKKFHGGETALLGQQLVNERADFAFAGLTVARIWGHASWVKSS